MPVFEKTDILSELKSTFYERMNAGQSEEDILSELGSPKALAISYMGDSIIEKQGFSLKRFGTIIGFYTVASMMWVSIIPILAVLSISFFFSSVTSVLAGIMGLLKGFVHIALLDNVKIMFFMDELKGLPALVVSWIFAIIFIGLAILCWKGTIQCIKVLRTQNWKMKHKGN